MNDPAPQPQGPLVVTKPCMNCGQDMGYVMPNPTIFNAINVSSIVFVHNRPDVCHNCGALFLPFVEGFDANGVLQLVWKPVKGNRQPMIVGGGANELKRAIESAALTEKIKREGN